MEWNADKYYQTCGRVTEQGVKLVEVLRDKKCSRVLDLGCGTGVLTNDIAAFANEVIGIDLSPTMIDKAKETYPDIQFQVMDACALTWDSYFDAVFSNAVLHFIQTQNILLDNVYKVLTMNGMFVCEFGASGNISGLLDAVAEACMQRGAAYSLRFFYPTKEEYGDLLIKHGFSIESILVYDIDTQLTEGEAGLRNWIRQIFSVEMEWFAPAEREMVLDEVEAALRPAQWDGTNWHLPNRRIQVVARKTMTRDD